MESRSLREPTSTYAQGHPLGPSPSEWRFSPKTQERLRRYEEKYPAPTGPVPTEDEELFCTCVGVDDGSEMVECTNGTACLHQWYHTRCIGMTYLPADHGERFRVLISNNAALLTLEPEDWFCQRCVSRRIGKAAIQPTVQACPSESRARRIAARPTLVINSSRESLRAPPTPSPEFQPWSAPLPLRPARTPIDFSENDCITKRRVKSDSYSHQGPNQARIKSKQPPWSPPEEEALITIMGELVAEGLAEGEVRWDLARVRLKERGFHRSAPATKMTWMRGLRERSGIDERKTKKMEALTTGLQKKKRSWGGEPRRMMMMERRDSM